MLDIGVAPGQKSNGMQPYSKLLVGNDSNLSNSRLGLSYSQPTAFYRELGYALAHETGHVVLRSSAHERHGLMKAVWAKDDWQRAAVAIIPFTLEAAKEMAGKPGVVGSPKIIVSYRMGRKRL